MKHLAAYLLLALGGKESPSAEDVTGLLTKLDVEVDAAKVEQLVKAMEGKNLDEVLEAGEKKLLAVGGGGGGGAAPAAAAGGAAAPAKKEEKKEKEKPKEEEVDIGTGGTDLFGGGGGGGKY
jgi:large subunit ribosomal protein LP2